VSAELPPTNLRLAGLVLAAGRGRRMGALKQTLPWPPSHLKPEAPHQSTVIASAFDAIAPFCQRLFVVVGGDAAAIVAALGDRSFVRVNADSDDEMFASIRAGFRAVLADADAGFDALLLQPGDHPGVARCTIEALLAEFQRDKSRAVMPEHRGKGGHPALIPRSLLQPILDSGDAMKGAGGGGGGGSGGLRQFWLDHPETRQRLAVDDPLCVSDLDTPADYAKSLRRKE